MAIQPINLGTGPFPANPASSETIYSAFQKTNANFAELDSRVEALQAADGNTRDRYAGATPYLLRGTVSGRLWPGITLGEGVSPSLRQANLANLQAAINYASSHQKFFELEPGIFEIEGTAGLLIPPSKSGFCWRGSKGSMLKQFASNCPILTIGDVTDRADDCQDLHLSGVRLFYAADQSGNAGSSALRIGLLRNSTIEQVSILAGYGPTGPLIKAYRGIHIAASGSRFGFFSNTVRDVFIGGADYSLLDIALVGTGSVFSNIYLTQGVTGHPAPIANAPLRISGNADQYETIFQQLNIEWCIANTLIQAQSCRGTSFLCTHLEGNRLVGRAASVMALATSQLSLTGLNILDFDVRRPAIVGEATPALFRCYGDNAINGNNLQVSWSSPGKVNTGLELLAIHESSPADAQLTVAVSNLIVRDVSGDNAHHLSLDANMPAASFPTPSAVENYRYRGMLSQTQGANIPVAKSITVFGQTNDSLIQYPAVLKAPCNVTLSNQMKPGGTGSLLSPLAGALVGVRRNSGVADAFPLVTTNHDGTVLSVISASSTSQWFRFDGTNWSLVA